MTETDHVHRYLYACQTPECERNGIVVTNRFYPGQPVMAPRDGEMVRAELVAPKCRGCAELLTFLLQAPDGESS